MKGFEHNTFVPSGCKWQPPGGGFQWSASTQCIWRWTFPSEGRYDSAAVWAEHIASSRHLKDSKTRVELSHSYLSQG